MPWEAANLSMSSVLQGEEGGGHRVVGALLWVATDTCPPCLMTYHPTHIQMRNVPSTATAQSRLSLPLYKLTHL